jgi:hypothetical protein
MSRLSRITLPGFIGYQKCHYSSLLAAMATVWNELTEAIKSEQSETKCKKKIAAFCSNFKKLI